MANGSGGAELLRVSEVQEVLGIGRSMVYDLIARHELPSLRIGRLVRVPRWALVRWIDERTDGGPPNSSEAA